MVTSFADREEVGAEETRIGDEDWERFAGADGLEGAGQMSFAVPLSGRVSGEPTRGRTIRRLDCRSCLGWPCWCTADDCFELFDNVEKAVDFDRLSGVVCLGIGELQGEAVASGGLVGEGVASGGT